ncbi:MAG: formimidoylglutamate deiminase [Amaricoccus sp.]
MHIHATCALLPEGWARNLRLTIADDRIAALAPDTAARPGDVAVDILLPGLPNLHSHTFQRGFSGLTEQRGPGRDSFWTWREMMYRFALALSPEEVEALATLAFVEMLEAGYTRVGEFHYLHHDPEGRPYADIAEMSGRIVAAAEATGIALTHLPVFYAHGGFGPAPAGPGQRRFLNDLDRYARLVERCGALLTRPQDRLGIAPHSLRAVAPDELAALTAAVPGRPVHIHVAEQTQEVDDCLAHSGARPVEWLLANAPVGADWCLIHATHLTPAETRGIADSRAVVGLCPITEANLGDGIFPAEAYLAAGGAIGVGTDSNVEITAAGELRLLEYSQRLATRARNVTARAGSTGARLFAAAVAGGSQALGAPAPVIAAGAVADLVGLADPMELGMADDRNLDRWVFGRDLRVADVWAAGRHLVEGGRHIHRAEAERNAARAIRRVLT